MISRVVEVGVCDTGSDGRCSGLFGRWECGCWKKGVVGMKSRHLSLYYYTLPHPKGLVGVASSNKQP